MTDRGLDRCPVCKYDLTGLPLEHRCPECGFEYDEHTWVWRRPPQRWRGWIVAGCASLFLALVGDVFRLLRIGFGTWDSNSFLGLAGVVAGCIGLAQVYRIVGVTIFVATTPRGVVLMVRRGVPLIVPWSAIDESKLAFGLEHTTARLTTIPRIYRQVQPIVEASGTAIEFRESVAEGKRRYLSQGAAASVESDK